MKKTLFSAAALVFLTACGSEAPEARFEKMAAGWCDCMAPLAEANRRFELLAADPKATTDTASVQRIFADLAAADSSARACSGRLLDKFKGLKPDEWPSAEPIFKKKCALAASQPALLKELLSER